MSGSSERDPVHLPIYLRSFADTGFPAKPKPPHRRVPKREALVFDCETTTMDGSQALRFGTYLWANGDKVVERGIFHDRQTITARELDRIKEYAWEHGLTVLTRDAFIDEVFFGRAYDTGASIVGFNLPFDLSRLAIRSSAARGAYRGGFSLELSEDPQRPHIQVKNIDSLKAMIRFAAPRRQRTPRGMRNRNLSVPVDRGVFIDLKSLANALLSGSHSLAGLAKLLEVPTQKQETKHGGALTPKYLDYALADTQCTWECFKSLDAQYKTLGLDLPINQLLSEASLGKATLAAMGIQPWRELQPDFPLDVLGKIMSTYFGGRSEVRKRRMIREVIYCDFLSMYPTVCAKMGLWRFITAKGMSWRHATDEVRHLIETLRVQDFQFPATWTKLCAIVLVEPDCDLFPVRADYAGKKGSRTIGVNYLASSQPLWFTLADCLASKVLTGKCPKIRDAIIFEPGEHQDGLKSINIRGDERYRVDPDRDDFFKRAVELRQEIKRQAKSVKDQDKARLDADQLALKIMSNATSYGIFIENIVRDQEKATSVDIHGVGNKFPCKTRKIEMLGRFYHPLLACLITGAARLLLALLESKVEEAGLDWVFCDTDSMAMARPDGLPREVFQEKVGSICDWFMELSPYEGAGSLLKIEDQNFSLDKTGRLDPLYCFAISAKRYALFNIQDGKPVIRKVSSHGLGHLVEPYDKREEAASLPLPHDSVLEDGTRLWHHDIWYHIVMAELDGHGARVSFDWHPGLQQPALSRYRASNPKQLAWFKGFNKNRNYVKSVKPFNFLLLAHAGILSGSERVVAPFDKDHKKALCHAFDRKTGKPVSTALLQTYTEALAQYHLHPEVKFLNGDFLDKGRTLRRHVVATGICAIGKEADKWEEQMHGAANGSPDITYTRARSDVRRSEIDSSKIADHTQTGMS